MKEKMKEIGFKIPEELYNEFKKFREQHGINSWGEFFIEAAKAYTRIYGVEKAIPVKDIQLAIYTSTTPARCCRCGREIKQGWHVYVVKTWGMLCKYCAADLKIDSGLIRLELEKTRLQREIKRLKKERDNLLSIIDEAEARKRVLDVVRKVEETMNNIEKKVFENLNLLREYMLTVGKRIELEQIAENINKTKEEILNELSEVRNKLDEIASQMISIKETTRKRKKKIEEEYSIWR